VLTWLKLFFQPLYNVSPILLVCVWKISIAAVLLLAHCAKCCLAWRNNRKVCFMTSHRSLNNSIIRLTIRPVLAGTVPVSRALSRRPGQSTKMSRLGIQSARIVPHNGVIAGRGGPIKCRPQLKLAYNNLKCLKISVNSVNTCMGTS